MYKGEVHLCFYQGTQMTGWGHGHGVIMDKYYRVVRSIEPSGSYQASSDMHEFMVIEDGKSALMTQYLRSAYDLCPWDLCDGFGYIQEGAFQEIDVETGKVNFEWKSLDHVDPSESYVGPGTTEISGSGQRMDSPWDYFHINSIDKNQDGDYLISARHVSALYKISGKDGHIIWRLHGAKSDYFLDGFSFSSQHDARWLSDNEDESVISMFDNGSNGFNQTHPHSMLKIIRLNHKTKTAMLDLNLDPPFVDGHAHISKSQGNFQTLPNGNIIAGWGNDAFWTEYAGEDHEIVFYGAIGFRNVMNYRVHKFDNWVGVPLTKPALWTYSKHGIPGAQMMWYASWNGATEVRRWRFYGSGSKAGPWKTVATVEKNGFETIYSHDDSFVWTYAEAMDKNDVVLGKSDIQRTFTPNENLKEYCDDLACQFMPTNEERQKIKDDRKKEQEEKETLLHQMKTKKKAIVYGGSFGALMVLLVILVMLSTRNVVRKPAMAVAANMVRVFHKTKKDDGVSGYKALSLEDQDSDRAPMIRDGS
jgi:Arylsulfotransferase (ASST)